MAARTRARSSGAYYPTDGNAAMEVERREELIAHAQELRRKRLMEERKQGLALRTSERGVAAAKRKRALSQWTLPIALCGLALLMLMLVMVRHLEVTRGAIAVNNLDAQLKEINADTERKSVDLALAAEVGTVKSRAASMGFSYPDEERIIRVTLPAVEQQPAQTAEESAGDEDVLGMLLGLLSKR